MWKNKIRQICTWIQQETHWSWYLNGKILLLWFIESSILLLFMHFCLCRWNTSTVPLLLKSHIIRWGWGWVLVFCVGCRDPGDCLSLVPVWFVRIGFWKIIWLGMGGDGFQTHKKKSWVSGQVRVERVLADAITIDGRKEWTCKFCSETNVWTRERCKSCGNNIPMGLQGKHKEAVYAKNKKMVLWLIVLEWGRRVEVSGARRDQEVASCSNTLNQGLEKIQAARAFDFAPVLALCSNWEKEFLAPSMHGS